jgi:hypothetical protein
MLFSERLSIDDANQKAYRRLPWLCALVVVASIFAACPFGNVAYADDWSYAATARALAQTGHFQYTGWSEPAVGIAACWAALLIRIFGFSYQLVRLSTVPLAAACALLLFSIGKRLGLSPSYCAFGTLALVLTPVLIPLGASFMTDVPSLLFQLITFYAEVRSLQTRDRRAAVGWLLVAFVSTALGGTVRQLVFLGGLAGLPAIAFIRRKDRAVAAAAFASWLALCVWMGVFIHWFTIQPHTETTPLSTLLHGWLRGPIWSTYALFVVVFTTAEFALPIALFSLPMSRKPRPLFWLGLVIFTVGSLLCVHHLHHDWNVVPWGDLLSYFGLYKSATLIGGRPRIAPYWVFVALTLLTYLAWGLFFWEMTPGRAELSSTWKRWRVILSGADRNHSPGEIGAIVFIPFTLLYTWVIWARASGVIFFDRYSIPLLPGIIFGGLCLLQKRRQRSSSGWQAIPTVAWCAIVVFGLYGVAISHDMFSLLRAEMRAAEALRQRGIPRNRISAGFEYDSTTQTNASFSLAQERTPSPNDPVARLQWYLPMLSAVQPQYFVVASGVPELEETAYPKTDYFNWLPPFHRELMIGKLKTFVLPPGEQ